MQLDFNGAIAMLAPVRQVGSARIRARWVVLRDSGGTPLDGFDVYQHAGRWHAWTSDTISERRITTRRAFADHLNAQSR
jgi:hypothetical protein